jgi:hypothetical protein
MIFSVLDFAFLIQYRVSGIRYLPTGLILLSLQAKTVKKKLDKNPLLLYIKLNGYNFFPNLWRNHGQDNYQPGKAQ